MDPEEDVREQVIAELQPQTYDEADLRGMALIDVVALHFNLANRFITAQPRQVHRSRALNTNPLATDPDSHLALEHIAAALEQGADLTPHLSRGVSGKYVAKIDPRGREVPASRRSHLDLLRADWGLYHLHLSTQPGPTDYVPFLGRPITFVQRGGPVLLAAIDEHDAYLVDIIVHGDKTKPPEWAKRRVYEILATEWPQARLTLQLQGLAAQDSGITDAQRQQLRSSGQMGSLVHQGTIHYPRESLTALGVSDACTDAAKEVMYAIGWVAAVTQKDPGLLAGLLGDKARTLDELDAHFILFRDGRYGIESQVSGASAKLKVTAVTLKSEPLGLDGARGFVEHTTNTAVDNDTVVAALSLFPSRAVPTRGPECLVIYSA